MNIAEVIQDAIRGRAPRRGHREYRKMDGSPPDEFLKLEVWPLFKEARLALEARGHRAIAARPAPGDESHAYALLILDSSCQKTDDACFLRYSIINGQIHVRVKTPQRNDGQPVLLDPPGSILLVRDLLEDFIFQCLGEKHSPALRGPEVASSPCFMPEIA